MVIVTKGNIVERITSEIEELTKLNGKPPKTLTVAEDIKREIFKIQNIEDSTQEFTEFKGITVQVIPSNTLLNWVLA